MNIVYTMEYFLILFCKDKTTQKPKTNAESQNVVISISGDENV